MKKLIRELIKIKFIEQEEVSTSEIQILMNTFDKENIMAKFFYYMSFNNENLIHSPEETIKYYQKFLDNFFKLEIREDKKKYKELFLAYLLKNFAQSDSAYLDILYNAIKKYEDENFDSDEELWYIFYGIKYSYLSHSSLQKLVEDDQFRKEMKNLVSELIINNEKFEKIHLKIVRGN